MQGRCCHSATFNGSCNLLAKSFSHSIQLSEIYVRCGLSSHSNQHSYPDRAPKTTYTAVQVSDCRVCPSFLSVSDNSSEYTCGRCAQVEELLSVVIELCEEVSRKRNIRESEKEMTVGIIHYHP